MNSMRLSLAPGDLSAEHNRFAPAPTWEPDDAHGEQHYKETQGHRSGRRCGTLTRVAVFFIGDALRDALHLQSRQSSDQPPIAQADGGEGTRG